jgi:hypothetical protein
VPAKKMGKAPRTTWTFAGYVAAGFEPADRHQLRGHHSRGRRLPSRGLLDRRIRRGVRYVSAPGTKLRWTPVDRADAQAWLDRYIAAWLSYDANDIAALFTEDVDLTRRRMSRPVRRAEPRDDRAGGRQLPVGARWTAVLRR